MKLEHANITVTDIEEAIRFLQAAFPSIHIRGEGPRQGNGRWCHIGTDETYIALQQEAEPSESNRRPYYDNGINHLGFVVNNVAEVSERLRKAGFQPNDMGVEEAGRTSVYFLDASANEWEFVQYHSDDNRIRNSYE